jgi:membrane-associated phospholipid phosphatase
MSAADSKPELSPPRLLTASLIAGLLAAGIALLIFSWLGREIVGGGTPGLDEVVRQAVHQHSSPTLTRIMIAASRYGGPSWLVPIGVALALLFLIRGWPRGALLIAVTLAGAALLNGMLKQTFARARPVAFFDYPLPTSLSFPSGHAFFAASFFGGLAVLVSSRVRSMGARVAMWALAGGLILLIGSSRVYLGVHYPSDVVAGYSAAVIWVAAIALGDRLVHYQRLRRSR